MDLPPAGTEPLGEFSLSDLVTSDPLGGDCIAEDDLDLAFFATGKGLRLPRTCLPEPCEQALTPFRLAELIGRPARPSEWDAYFSRYADVCRKEIVSFDDGEAVPGPLSPQAFWAPILATAGASAPVARTPVAPVRVFSSAGPNDGFTSTGGGGGGGSSSSSTGGEDDDQSSTTSTRLIGDPDPDGDPPTSTTLRQRPPADPDGATAPSAVPLPLGGWLLLSALSGLTILRRKAFAA